MRGGVHVVQVPVERIEEFPEKMLVQIAGPPLQRILEPEELIQLVGQTPQTGSRILEPLVDGQRAALERARRHVPALSSAGDALPLDRLENAFPFGQRGMGRLQRGVQVVAHRSDPLVLMDQRVLDLEREAEEVLLASHVGARVIDHSARRVDLLRPRLLEVRAQDVEGFADDSGVLHQRDEAFRTETLDHPLLGVERHAALRDDLLALVRAKVAQLSQRLAHLDREARDLPDLEPFGAALHETDRQLRERLELARVVVRLVVEEAAYGCDLLVDERAEGRAEARHDLGLVQVLGSGSSHASRSPSTLGRGSALEIGSGLEPLDQHDPL